MGRQRRLPVRIKELEEKLETLRLRQQKIEVQEALRKARRAR